MFFIVTLLFFYQTFSQSSVTPIWIPNLYLQTKPYQIKSDFSTTTQNAAANITFTQVYSTPPKIAFGITTYSGNDGLYQQNFYMNTLRVTESLVEIKMVIVGVTNIRLFYVMYIAVHPDFLYHLNAFNDIEANYTQTGQKSLDPINNITAQMREYTNYINYTDLCTKRNTKHKQFGSNLSKNKVAVYLSGVYNQAAAGIMTEIKFDILTEAVNSTHFKLNVSVYPNYRIWLLRLSFIGMDIENIQSSKQYTLVYSTDRYYFDKDYYIPLEKEFFGNIFVGMLNFNTQSPSCTIDFNLVFDQPNSRIIVKKSVPNPGSFYPNCGLKSAQMNIFYMKTWLCPPPNYFFNLDTDMCDDNCPKYNWEDKVAKQCVSCPGGCASCDPINMQNPKIRQNCTSCDSEKDFRELKFGKCQCMKGYYLKNPTDVACTPCSGINDQCLPLNDEQTNTLAKFILYGSYAILALSAIPCKIVGLQLFGVLQIAYFSLAEITDLNAVLKSLIGLSPSNGFNPHIISSHSNLPNKISLIGYDGSFLNNCGLMMLLLIVEGIIALTLYLVSVFIKPTLLLSSISKRLLKEGFLTLIIFNSFNFSFGTAVHFKYSSSKNEGYIINSLFSILGLIGPIIMIFGLALTESKEFGEFKDKFKKQRVSQLYFVVTLLYRYFLGYLMAAKSDNQFGSLIVIMVSLLFILYNFVNLPFKTALHNYRANFCHLSQLGILVVANYYESMKSTTDDQVKFGLFTGAYLQYSMIILAMVVSIIGLSYEVYYFTKQIVKKKCKRNSQVSNQSIMDKNSTQPKIDLSNQTFNSSHFVQYDNFRSFNRMNKDQNNELFIQDIGSTN